MQYSYCGNISLDNNNSVKFTSSRGDNFTTNDSMVMKIAHAQLHMYANIMYRFQSTHSSIPPSTSLWGIIKISMFEKVEKIIGKGENAGYKPFLLFALCFQKH